jgi:hypothetical protein
MNKNNEGFLDGSLDPAVQAALGSGNKRQAERSMPREQRKRKLREKAKGEARKGQRALYDLPEELIEEVKKVAAQYSTSASQIAKLAILMFLQAEKNGYQIDVRAYRVPAGKNPKFEYVIELPE